MEIVHAAVADIKRHASATYPEECCGVLLGSQLRTVQVFRTVAVNNKSEEHRERHYTIDAPTLFRITREAELDGLDVVGFYHSHPDHPARPSQTDLEEATFPGYAYLIQSVIGGTPGELTAWRLSVDRSRFDPEAILALEENAETKGDDR